MGHFRVARRIRGPERRMEAGWAKVLCVWNVFAPRRNGGEGVDGDGGFVLGGWRSAGGSRMRACGFGQTESNGG